MQWTTEQQKVIDLRDRDILVSAAAGSGKTAVLVERIIQRVTDPKNPIDIDRLLVVTFTKAAAAEMRERIGAAIDKHGKAWWNKGFTTEALRAVVEYWFKNTNSNWLACCHAAANPASGRVMQKAGFVYHHDAEYHKFDGTPVSCKCYALTREHYNTLYK